MGSQLCGAKGTQKMLEKQILQRKDIQNFLIRYPLIAQKLQFDKKHLPNLQVSQISQSANRILFKFHLQSFILQRNQSLQKALIFQQQKGDKNYCALFYQGEINEDQKKNGQGKAIFSNGDVYQGKWKDEKINGYGKFITYENKSVYQGFFNQFKKQGKGQIRIQNSNQNFKYEGQWKNDMFHGKGLLIFQDKSSYEGQFYQGRQQGHGIYCTNSMRYQGSWKDCLMCGSGTTKWFCQKGQIISSYTGEYLKGKKHGFGEYITKDKKLLRGEWFQGKFRPGADSFVID